MPQKADHTILIKKIAFRAGLALTVLFILYLWVFGIFSNIQNLWGNVFRRATTSNIDVISPLPPYLNRISNFTNKLSTDISGTAESGNKIELYLNDQKIESTIADKDGYFSFMQITIQPTNNRIFAVAYDDSGNKSVDSLERTIIYDNKKPEIEITSPASGEDVSNSVRSFTVSGKTKASSKVTINGQVAQMMENGDFTAQIYPQDGSNKVTIEVTDSAGNSNKKEVFFTFSEDQP